jgi:aspartyl-tRNA(Asn)/glutamyl-tRNA(Gln) amidotransferase subunit C
MANITEETVKHVAKLARLALTPEETVQYAQELGKILGLIDQLSELDLNSENTSLKAAHPTLFREDIVKKEIDTETLLANAPQKENTFFRVPQILETKGS